MATTPRKTRTSRKTVKEEVTPVTPAPPKKETPVNQPPKFTIIHS